MSSIARGARGLCVVAFLAVLAACGGGGGGGGGSGSPAPVTPPSKLFVTDEGNAAIGSLANANPGAGALSVDRIVVGTSTQLPDNLSCPGCIGSVALDAANDRLFVAANIKILVFDNISTASGNVAPTRTFNSSGTFHNLLHLALDTTNDVLYAGDDRVTVTAFASASSANGGVTPARILTADIPNPSSELMYGVAVDVGRDRLYLLNYDTSTVKTAISSFTASTANGTTAPGGSFTIPASSTNRFFLDAAGDRLYIADPGGGIGVYDGASGLTGAIASSNRTISLPVGGQYSIFVDTVNDRLYAVAFNRGYIVAGASSANNGTPFTLTAITVSTTANPIQLSAVAVKP